MKRTRIRRSRAEIAAIVSSFRNSGQSALAFARSQGIAVSSLRLWASSSAAKGVRKRPAEDKDFKGAFPSILKAGPSPISSSM